MLFLSLFQFIVNVLNEPKDKALKTYSYRLQLINGGVTKFHLHSVMIQEVINETREDIKTAK